MKMLGILLLLSISGAVIGGFADEGRYIPSVFIGDGSGITAVRAIESISAITEELPGKLEFTCSDPDPRFSKSTAKSNPIRRQAERLPYKIDLEN